MSSTATVTRSTTVAGAGDSGAGVALYERDADTGVITFGGQNRQLWVLVYEGTGKKDVPTCGAIYTSGEDGGEIICLRKCTSRKFGIEAITKHDRAKDIVHACSRHRGNPEVLSKLEYTLSSPPALSRGWQLLPYPAGNEAGFWNMLQLHSTPASSRQTRA